MASMAAPDLRVAALTRFSIAITIFNVVGHLWLGFEQSVAQPFVSVLTAYATELVLECLDAWASSRSRRFTLTVRSLVIFLLPAHITGVACAMLLYAGERTLPVAFAAAVAIASKYVLRVPIDGRARHVLNPSNFGITVTLLALPSVGISMPYMFTENLRGWGNWLLPAIMITSGTLLNARFTHRMPLVLAWPAAFAGQALVRSLTTGTLFLPALVPMTGIAFILFTFYMVTDPSTTPSGRGAQIAFGTSVAAAYGILMAFHVVFGLFFALTTVCLLRGLWILGSELASRRAARARITADVTLAREVAS
jgi:hypothetical protein